MEHTRTCMGCTCTHGGMSTHVHTLVHIYAHTHSLHMHTRMHAGTYACMHTLVHTLVHTHAHTECLYTCSHSSHLTAGLSPASQYSRSVTSFRGRCSPCSPRCSCHTGSFSTPESRVLAFRRWSSQAWYHEPGGSCPLDCSLLPQ